MEANISEPAPADQLWPPAYATTVSSTAREKLDRLSYAGRAKSAAGDGTACMGETGRPTDPISQPVLKRRSLTGQTAEVLRTSAVLLKP